MHVASNMDDLKTSTFPVIDYNIITNFNAEAEGISSLDVIKNLTKEIYYRSWFTASFVLKVSAHKKWLTPWKLFTTLLLDN